MFAHGHGGFPNTLCHVPLIIQGPGIPAGRTVSRPVSSIGLMATILDLLGIERPGRGPGQSFKDLIYDEAAGHGPLYMVNVADSSYALIEGDYKLVVDRESAVLYNLRGDWDEENDILSDNPDLARSLIGTAEDIAERNRRRRLGLEALHPAPESDSLDPGLIKTLRSLGYIQ
jgi:arylsulfatase A-like enzyme